MIPYADRQHAVSLIAEAISNGARKEKACKEIGISLRTYQRWIRDGGVKADGRPLAQRPAPHNKLSEQEIETIIEIANSEPYKSLPPSQIVPTLADNQQYIASESTVYRVLHKARQQHHRGRAKAPERKPLSTHKASAPNQVWCWDITWLPGPAKGLYYYLYLIIDLYSRKVVGWEVYENESSDQASILVEKTCWKEHITLATLLVLHSDNGSPMKGSSLQETLYRLGISSSYSRPRVSNDNAFVESFFRTCKYRPDYPHRGFATIEDAQAWVLKFISWYNDEHKHSALKFVTPNQRHNGDDKQIREDRKAVYEAAKKKHPSRWSGETRNWDLLDHVWLNPEKEDRILSHSR